MSMTLLGKSITVVLTGVLATVVAVALPLLSAFGEGGAQRDVVRNGTTMGTLYLVEFMAAQAGAPPSREQTIEQIEQLDKVLIPSLESLGKESRILAGGIAAGTFTGAFVIEAKSKDEVTALVSALPASSMMKWQVTPIETFAYRADIEKKIVQGLRAQK
jgi:muconolactone delta-isomerase